MRVSGAAGLRGEFLLPADLNRRDEVEKLAAEAGPVAVLVSNAGLPASGPLFKISIAGESLPLPLRFTVAPDISQLTPVTVPFPKKFTVPELKLFVPAPVKVITAPMGLVESTNAPIATLFE